MWNPVAVHRPCKGDPPPKVELSLNSSAWIRGADISGCSAPTEPNSCPALSPLNKIHLPWSFKNSLLTLKSPLLDCLCEFSPSLCVFFYFSEAGHFGEQILAFALRGRERLPSPPPPPVPGSSWGLGIGEHPSSLEQEGPYTLRVSISNRQGAAESQTRVLENAGLPTGL